MKKYLIGLWAVGSVLLFFIYYFNRETTLGFSDTVVHFTGGMATIAIILNFSKKNLFKKIALINAIFLLWEVFEISLSPIAFMSNDFLYRMMYENPLNRISDLLFDYLGAFAFFRLTTLSTTSASFKSTLNFFNR